MDKVNQHTEDLINMLDESADRAGLKKEDNIQEDIKTFNKEEAREKYTDDMVEAFDDLSLMMGQDSLTQIENAFRNDLENHLNYKYDDVAVKIKMVEFEDLIENSSDTNDIANFVLSEGTVLKSKIAMDYCKEENIKIIQKEEVRKKKLSKSI